MTRRDKSESQEAITLSGDRCVVCGWAKKKGNSSLVEGAHVRPFSNTSDYDKRDNIIALCPNHHTEYDAGLLTIDPANKICIYADEKDEGHLKLLFGKVDHVMPGNFDYHRVHIFGRK